MPKAPHFMVCVLLDNAQVKIVECLQSKFQISKNQKLNFHLGVTRWRGTSLSLAPRQTEQCYNNDGELVICVYLLDSE